MSLHPSSPSGNFTSLVEMVWLLVPDRVFAGRPIWFRPPIGRPLLGASVRVRGLFLRRHCLDPSLRYELASRLLNVLEPLGVDFRHGLRVADLNALLG
jgi:hypothetical protein